MEDNQQATKYPSVRSFGRYRRYIEPIARDPLIRGYFEIVATLLLISFFLLFAIRPTLNTVFGLQRKIADLIDVNNRLDSKIQSLITAQSNYAKFEPQLFMLDRALPSRPEVDTMVIDIENIVAGSGTKLNSLTVARTGLTPDAWTSNLGFETGKRVPLAVSLNVAGDFVSGQNLLKTLIKAPRIITVNGITFAKIDAKTADLNVNITGVGYFLP